MADLTVQQARQHRLDIRAFIRSENHLRPRCSGCGNQMLLYFDDLALITKEILQEPQFSYLLEEDYRPGDLICFWCLIQLSNREPLYIWGNG